MSDLPLIVLVGAGNLGSRHLQALSRVQHSLSVTVIDPSEESLDIAKERWIQMACDTHSVRFTSELPRENDIYLAIIATNADVRLSVISELLSKNGVKNLILEKLLFTSEKDFKRFETIIEESRCSVFVNCAMRTMPFYYAMKEELGPPPYQYSVVGSQYGMVTNAIHYLDHLVYLSGSNVFTVDTSALMPDPIASKRSGFLELNGTMRILFSDGSVAAFTCFADGNLPLRVEISSSSYAAVCFETDRMATICNEKTGWSWTSTDLAIPYQSEMTSQIVTDLLLHNRCNLVTYEESMKTHLQLLNPLRAFLESNGVTDHEHDYPFT